MHQTQSIIEIPGLLQNKTYQKLTFTNSTLTIERTLSYAAPLILPSENIAAFRYGVKWVKGYQFAIGRQYFIDIQDFDNKEYQIKLGSYYGIRREEYFKIWQAIFKQLWAYYFINQFNYYKELLTTKQVFELCGLTFHESWLSWGDKNNLFWNEIGLSNYKTYFMIYNLNNTKQHKDCNFANNWNAFIAQKLLKAIVEEQNKFRNASV